MKYGGCLFAVKDIAAARKFYEELFHLKVIVDYGKNIVFEGGLSLQQDFDWLTGIAKEEIRQKENNCEIFFEEENFDAFILCLQKRKNIVLLHEISEAPWGQRIIRFYDPDYHLIEVGESLNSVIKRFERQGMNLKDIAKRMDITLDDIARITNE